jgi:hypothetical protein
MFPGRPQPERRVIVPIRNAVLLRATRRELAAVQAMDREVALARVPRHGQVGQLRPRTRAHRDRTQGHEVR